MELIIQLIFVAIGLTLGYVFGSKKEKEHYQNLLERHRKLKHIPVRVEKIKDVSKYCDAQLFVGNVVIANDYFKTFVASIKGLFGGRLSSYESLMDRSRREAILRLKEHAIQWGANEVLELRLESSALDALGVEILAYGTAVKYKNEIHS